MHQQYRTPKRRHSSLFQRMQQQIEKISKKLSAAKSSARQSSYQKIKSLSKQNKKTLKENKNVENLFQNTYQKSFRKNIHFDQFREPSVIQTVRINRIAQENLQRSPLSGKKTVNSKTLVKRLNFGALRDNNNQQRISQLQKQNQQLSLQIKKLQLVCQDQSYRLGYSSAYFQDKMTKMEKDKEEYRKQNVYLKKLCQHYKSKSKKYKDGLKKYAYKNASESSSESS